MQAQIICRKEEQTSLQHQEGMQTPAGAHRFWQLYVVVDPATSSETSTGGAPTLS